jgi:hypothetical protein
MPGRSLYLLSTTGLAALGGHRWALPQSVRYRIFRLHASYLSATSHTGRQPCRVKSLYMKRFCFIHSDVLTSVGRKGGGENITYKKGKGTMRSDGMKTIKLYRRFWMPLPLIATRHDQLITKVNRTNLTNVVNLNSTITLIIQQTDCLNSHPAYQPSRQS